MAKPLNKFLVRPAGDRIAVYNLPITSRRGEGAMPDFPVIDALTPEEAVNLAAWLVSVAGHLRTRARRAFYELLNTIEDEEDPEGH